MKIKNLTKTLIVLTLVVIMGIGATAFAGKGKGSTRYAQDGQGSGRYACDGSGYGRNQKFMGNLSEEEITKLNEERNTFFKANQDLRRNIYQKRLELNSELAKKNPDSKKAGALQKELSGFKGQFDQKRTEHRIKMSKINPNFGLMGQGFRGKGMGKGKAMGREQNKQNRQ
jgi:Spy/CpxP family protein refolding chaperone